VFYLQDGGENHWYIYGTKLRYCHRMYWQPADFGSRYGDAAATGMRVLLWSLVGGGRDRNSSAVRAYRSLASVRRSIRFGNNLMGSNEGRVAHRLVLMELRELMGWLAGWPSLGIIRICAGRTDVCRQRVPNPSIRARRKRTEAKQQLGPTERRLINDRHTV